MSNEIKPVTVLHGHVSPETAYLVEDHPYGRQLRCKIRYWVETADKGAAKGRQRFVYQTTNPKHHGEEVWNKPHPSTYYDMVLLTLEPQDDGRDFVQSRAVDLTWPKPAGWHRCRIAGVYAQMTDGQRGMYDRAMTRSRLSYPKPWDEWRELVGAVADHIREHGTDPVVDNGTWEDPAGRRRYLGADLAVLCTVAREVLAEQARQPEPVVETPDDGGVQPGTGPGHTDHVIDGARLRVKPGPGGGWLVYGVDEHEHAERVCLNDGDPFPAVPTGEDLAALLTGRCVVATLEVENAYELHDATAFVYTDAPLLLPPAGEDARTRWAEDVIDAYTGTGPQDGDSWHDMEIVASSRPDVLPVGETFDRGY